MQLYKVHLLICIKIYFCTHSLFMFCILDRGVVLILIGLQNFQMIEMKITLLHIVWSWDGVCISICRFWKAIVPISCSKHLHLNFDLSCFFEYILYLPQATFFCQTLVYTLPLKKEWFILSVKTLSQFEAGIMHVWVCFKNILAFYLNYDWNSNKFCNILCK